MAVPSAVRYAICNRTPAQYSPLNEGVNLRLAMCSLSISCAPKLICCGGLPFWGSIQPPLTLSTMVPTPVSLRPGTPVYWISSVSALDDIVGAR